MKVYISDKSQLTSKRIILFLGCPLLLTILILMLIYPNKQHGEIWGSLYTVLILALALHASIKPNVLVIADNKITLKGPLHQITYDLMQFKEVTKTAWQNGFSINFTDGKSYEFYSRFRGFFYQFKCSRKEQIADLNLEIRAIIQNNSHSA